MIHRRLFLIIAMVAGLCGAPAASAQGEAPADTLRDIRPFGTHALELLAGQEAGVEVISSLGVPGMTPTIHIRGFDALPQLEPVYIVDGMRRRDLEGIAPEAIEKIEVLKNAAAMGLYGPDAAAGVVVITTRRASQNGFHAGYDFVGGIQSLAHEPQAMTLETWNSFSEDITGKDYMEPEKSIPETTFLHRHHLYAQYGGKTLSAYAGFTLLDNDGPHPGRADSHRRYAASWSAEYRPLSWISLETTGRWSQSRILQAKEKWLEQYLVSRPVYNDQPSGRSQHMDRSELSETLVQGKLEVRPLPGMYLRGTGGYASRTSPYFQADWEELAIRLEATSGHKDTQWYQWGAEAGWSGQWKGHRLGLGATFRRIKEKQELWHLHGRTNYDDWGLPFGDDDHLEEKYLLPAYRIYQQAENPALTVLETGLTGVVDRSSELKWKEAVARVHYDWQDRYRLDFSYFRLWEDTLFSGEGYRVPAVTLGWTLTREPWLRRALPRWWESLSVEASWAQPVSIYQPMLQPELTLGVFRSISTVTMDTAHRDLSVSASFRTGGVEIDFSGAWFLYDDGLTRYWSMYTDGTDTSRITSSDRFLNLRNQGVELSAAVRGNAGAVRYALDGHLTFYRNRISFGESLLRDVANMSWTEYCLLGIKDGEPVGGLSYRPEGSNAYSEWGGNTFPVLTGGLRAALGWNRWQLTVSGHGDAGQTVLHRHYDDALSRYYLESNPDLQPWDVFSSLAFLNEKKGILPASFFKLDLLRLDYTLPLRGGWRLNFFASLENGILLTRYPGSDPELALAWEGLGTETATYPSTRRMLFGLQVGF